MVPVSAELPRCQYSLDVSEWYDERRRLLTDRDVDIDLDEEDPWEFADGFLTEDGEWQCHRRTRPEDSHCLFHAHESDNKIESAARPGQVFRDIVAGETEDRHWNKGYDGLWEVPQNPPERETPFTRDEFKHRERQFIGATLGAVELSYETLDGPGAYPIDLRVARTESLDLYGSEIGAGLDLRGLIQTSENGVGSAYRDERSSDEAYGIELKKAKIEGGLTLNDADLAAGVRLRESAPSYVRLDRAAVGGDVAAALLESSTISFKRARIRGSIVAADTTCSESIRLRGAHVDDDVSLKRTTVNQQVSLTGMTAGRDVKLQDLETGRSVFANRAQIDGELSLNRAAIGRSVVFNDAELGAVSVKYAHLTGNLKMNRATVSGHVTVENTDIEDRVTADELRTEGYVSFENASVERLVSLTDVASSGSIRFDQADLYAVKLTGEAVDGGISFDLAEVALGVIISVSEVTGDISFENSLLGDELYIEYIDVGGSVVLRSTAVNGNRSKTALRALNVADSVDIAECRFASDLDIDGVDADGTISVTETAVDGELWLSHPTTTVGRLDLSETTATELTIRCGLVHPAVSVVTLERTTFETATLQARNENDDAKIVYDLREATVGNFDLEGDSRDNDADTRAFEQLRFLKTTFDGFVFSERRGQFGRTDWQAHRPRDGGYEDIAVVSQVCEGPIQSAEGSDNTGDRKDWGRAIEVSRDIVAAAGYDAVRTALEEAFTGEPTETEPTPDTDRPEAAEDSPPTATDTAAAHPMVRAYLDGAITPASAPVPVSGDPFSTLVERLGQQWTPSPQRAHSEQWKPVATSQLDDLVMEVHEQVAPVRTRRALELPYSAANRAETIFTDIHAALSASLSEYESLPTGSLPTWIDIEPGDSLTGRRLTYAVLFTFADSGALERFLATIDDVEADRTDRSTGTAVDGGIPVPVDSICMEWSIETGPGAGAFDTAICEALTEAIEVIVDAAVAIDQDRDRLAAAGLGPDAVTEDADDVTAPHPESAIADAISRYDLVSDAEFVADSYRRAEVGVNDDEEAENGTDSEMTAPQFRRVAERLGIDPSDVDKTETAVARDLVDYRTARGKLEELESTYALAKNGASEAGDETAAGNFFQQQAGYARRQHWQQLTNSSAGKSIDTDEVPDTDDEDSSGTDAEESTDIEESTETDEATDTEESSGTDAEESSGTDAEESTDTDEVPDTSVEESSSGITRTLLGLLLLGAVGVYATASGDLVALVETLSTSGASGLGTDVALSSRLLAGVVVATFGLWLISRRVLGQLGTWLGNVFLWLTMGYGEKPTRVLLFSAVIIGGFAVLYELLGASVAPVFDSAFLGRLVFSFDVFVTLALGEPPGVDETVRLLAVVEGFAGVFVIGMFVVTVTRAVHR